MNLNSSPSPFPIEQINNIDHDQLHHALNLGPNHQVVSSSSPSCHFFFNSTQDHAGRFCQPHHQQDDNYACNHGGSCYEIKNKVESSLKLALWKKEFQGHVRKVSENDNQVKWISSMMRVKNLDHKAPTVSTATAKIEAQKQQSSSSFFDTELSSNSSSHAPIRVCSDCHTTKTPLWRSGPKGPKSLCNACGIRQRKARRAMAAAAAAANATVVAADQPRPMKIKVEYKEKMAKNSTQFKKRRKMAANGGGLSESSGKKKLGFEDFLINLSNKLAFHRMFPQDVKDAAILLMALSSGLVHG